MSNNLLFYCNTPEIKMEEVFQKLQKSKTAKPIIPLRNSLFPVGAAGEADVEILELGDSLPGEVADEAVGVFG